MTHLPGPATARHLDHDTVLVAALAAGDLADLPRADAEALVAACPDCATLHADLLAIAAATHALPPPIRTRDFRLSPAQAARLRPTTWRRLVAALGSSRSTIARPLAVTFTTLGLAGLLLTAIPAGGPVAWFGASGAGREATVDTTGEQNVIRPLAGLPSPEVDRAPDPSEEPKALGPGDALAPGQRDERAADSGGLAGPGTWLPVLSISMLLIGLSLFALRRLGRDP